MTCRKKDGVCSSVLSSEPLLEKMFKRPLPRPVVSGVVAPRTFSFDGRAASIIETMRSVQVARPPVRQWTPPIDYEFVASRLPERDRPAFIKRCEDWNAANTQPEVAVQAPKPVINPVPVAECIVKHGTRRPPLAEYTQALKLAGYPQETINHVSAHYQRLEDTYEERTAKLDLIFAKWPAANKPTVKPRTKVIKAVKKKM